MEILQQGRYWVFKNIHGPVPKELRGSWVSIGKAQEALELFQAGVRARAKNVSEISRKRRAATTNNV